ncbi:MAG: GIY-YIG nuclease family protein [Prolixibacteraceae bacterium]|nr:GIY-YIG nuclease family protein [Prolixibacteraceae bacterium]
MKLTVYVLYSENFNKLYVGVTSNLEQRVYAHNHTSQRLDKKF